MCACRSPGAPASDPATSWGTIEEDDPTVAVHTGPFDGVYQFTGVWFAPVNFTQIFPKDIILEADVQFWGEIEQAQYPYVQQQLAIEFKQSSRQISDGDFFYLFFLTSDGFVGMDKMTWVKDDGVFTTSATQLIDPVQGMNFKSGSMNHFRLNAVEIPSLCRSMMSWL